MQKRGNASPDEGDGAMMEPESGKQKAAPRAAISDRVGV